MGLAHLSRKFSRAEDYGNGPVAGLDAEAGAATKVKVTPYLTALALPM